MKELKSLYSLFLGARKDEIHCAAHSHHFWPDITREAQLESWDDAARLNDRKWGHIFSHVVPKVQRHIARILHLRHPEMIALSPNTHDLVTRLFSQLLTRSRLKVLTSDSEFHSFSRQLRRYQEAHPQLQVTRLATAELRESRNDFIEKLLSEGQRHDVVFLSQVFYNSGIVLTMRDWETLAKELPSSTILIIDGYHGFAALPTNLSRLEGRVFYLGGGYKYAQGGEGVGFMVVPRGDWSPVITGWFAEFAQLSAERPGQVGFSQDGMAFWGATQDPTGWYRFNATWDQFQRLGIGVEDLHLHVRRLQNFFLENLPASLVDQTRPVFGELDFQGHFLTFEAVSETAAQALKSTWEKRGIYTDLRGARLRFGFGAYHDLDDLKELIKRLNTKD